MAITRGVESAGFSILFPMYEIDFKYAPADAHRQVMMHNAHHCPEGNRMEDHRNPPGDPMQLIGMLDSPFVRRVAISFDLQDIPFEHKALSVFRNFDEFSAINPTVKAPTLVLDDGSFLIDSTLMLEYGDALAGNSLLPTAPAARARALRAIGPALAACEKTAQIVYEYSLRPQEKQHQPWLDRVQQQLFAALRLLEAETDAFDIAALDQAAVTAAVTWSFVQLNVAQIVKPDDFPRLAAWTARAEALPVFQRYPLV
jgi:glutathione S-transferase